MRSRPRRPVSRSAVGDRAPPQTIVVQVGRRRRIARWMSIERDGKNISVPRYGDGRGDDCLEGEVATPAVLIEHAAAVASEPEPAASSPMEACRLCLNRSPPPSVTSASGSTPGFAIASSPIRSPPVCSVVSRSSRGRIGRRFRTARRGRVFIGPVTPNGGLSGKRRRGRRWGSRAEPFRSERSRRMRGADVARVARSPPTAGSG